MVRYQTKTKSFLLSGKNFSYAVYVNAAGYLQTLYYGAKITESDSAYLITHIGETAAPNPEDKNADLFQDGMPAELGCYAHGDYREPTVIVTRADGASMSRFRFCSFKVYSGVPALNGLPHARQGGETLAVTLKDDFSDAEIVINYTVWDDLDVLVRNMEIVNTGKEAVILKKAFSFCTDLPECDYGLLRLEGVWGKERTPEVTPLGHGITRLQTLRGKSSHYINPFMGILCKACTEFSGECYGVQLVYSGSFAITAEKSSNGTVRVQGGINDTNFGWELAGGERFITPQAALCYSREGLGGMSRSYADFLRAQIIDPVHAFEDRPIVANNWEATYFDFDAARLLPIIDWAAGLGVDTFVLDDGWFGKRNDDKSGLGDWYVNEKKLEGGLKRVIRRCKERGLKFGLWFEPEMVSEDSDLYRAHPDWAIAKEGFPPAFGRNQLVLDFTRKEVVDYVFRMVSKVLDENEISYVKWDMNRDLTEYFSKRLPAHRQGEFAHRYVLGVYDLAERLTRAYPNVFFEGCASGGGRFDAGALYYFPQIWTSDDTDGFERTKIQWGTSTCYPVSSMSCHVSACPNHQTGRITPFETRGVVASLGAFGYELDLSKLTEAEKWQVMRQIENYRRIQGLVLKGDLYRLSNPFEQNYFCVMLVSKDKTEAYVAGERILGDPCDHNRILKLRGLDENKVYTVEELGITASGSALVNAGVLFPKLPDFGSWTWHIREEKGS